MHVVQPVALDEERVPREAPTLRQEDALGAVVRNDHVRGDCVRAVEDVHGDGRADLAAPGVVDVLASRSCHLRSRLGLPND